MPAVWVQDDLLKLLEAMKVALPQKDLTKYKTSESHLDWQKVAFNSYTAEMCKQKWQEVSKEVRPLSLQIATESLPIFRCRNVIFSMLFLQIRKFRTLTELIVDAQDYIKNPYKGKKIKVGEAYLHLLSVISMFLVLILNLLHTETPRLPQEAPDTIFPLLHGKEGQVRKVAPRDEQPRPH